MHDKVILHSDLNGFYASVECFHNPNIRHLPVAVCGDIEARHGIVLAKNEHAKMFGIKTGHVIWEAKRLCPSLAILNANFNQYIRFSSLAKKIYSRYSNKVESFGIDECWLDVSGGDGKKIADEIRETIKRELGITASRGFLKLKFKRDNNFEPFKIQINNGYTDGAYELVKREETFERPDSILLNGLNEYKCNAGLFVVKGNTLVPKNIADKILDKYQAGVSFVDADWKGNTDLNISNSKYPMQTTFIAKSIYDADGTEKSYECLSNEFKFANNFRQKTKGRILSMD